MSLFALFCLIPLVMQATYFAVENVEALLFVTNCNWYKAASDRNNYRVLKIENGTFNDTTRSVFRPRTATARCQSSNSTDITVITQLTTNRLYLLEPLAERWPGSIVFVLYYQKTPAFSRLLTRISTSKSLSSRQNILYFAVYRVGDKQYQSYPINILRNIALHAARTKYVLYLDADMIPNNNIYNSLLQQLLKFKKKHRYRNGKVAFVIPAFQSVSTSASHALRNLPPNKTALKNGWLRQNKFTVFHTSFPQGHAPTNSNLWANSTQPYTVQWRPDYEPYILAKRCEMPQFPEQFVGRGFNKNSYFYKLESERFQLVVLPNDFLVHIPHPVVAYNEFRNKRKCLEEAKSKFLVDIGFCKISQSFCRRS